MVMVWKAVKSMGGRIKSLGNVNLLKAMEITFNKKYHINLSHNLSKRKQIYL